MQFIGPELLEAIATGADPLRDGNHVREYSPHNVYPAAGEDAWVAIAAPDEAAWRRLCAIVGPPLAADPRFATAEQRLHHQDHLDAVISAWTKDREKHEIARQLQEAGVPAAPVLDASELRVNPFFTHRQSFVRLPHPEAGVHLYQTVPIRLTRTPGQDRTAAPLLGEHTDAVLAELGVSAADRERLRRDGITADRPI